MNARIICLALSCFLLQRLTATAHTGSISGRVANEAGLPVSLASVLLMNAADSSLIKTELTDIKGEFRLTPETTGLYFLKVSMLGYETYYTDALTVTDKPQTVSDIMMISTSTELDEVAIRSQKPFIEVHADKLVVNVENSIVNSGSTALEVLSRSPGVTVDNNDNISLKGKQGVNVMINGKRQPLSAQELADMLKSTPSSSIDKIEIISNPSARYDAAGTAGIINIKMKRDKKTGLNGSVNGTYAQGVYKKTNGGINLNYRNKKLNLFGSYNRSDRRAFNHLVLDRNFYNNSVFSGAYVQDNNYYYNMASDNGSVGIDYSLSSKTSVGASVSASGTDFKRTGYNYSKVIDSATQQQLSHFVTDNSAPNHWGSRAVNLNLRHSFDSTGKSLSVDVDYAAYPSRGQQHYTTNYFDDLPDGSFMPSGNPPVIFRGDLKGLTEIRSAKADYSMPIGKGIKMDVGAKVSYVTSDNDLDFYNYSDGDYISDTSRTNHFIYRENINAGYVNFNKSWKKWSLQAGLRAEQTIAKGDANTLAVDSSFKRNYAQLFPSIALQRHLNPKNELGITLSRRIERPGYDQLNPSTYYLDPTTYKAGDPYLNPALSYNSELSYTYKQRFITSVNYTHTTAPITQVIQPSTTESKVTIQTNKNLSGMDYYGLSGSYQFRFTNWWNNTTNVNAYYSHYTGNIANSVLNAGRTTFNVNSNNSFILPRSWAAEIGGFYQAPQVYGYMNLKPTWMLNMGVQKNFLDKRATLRLRAQDIFWKGNPRATSNYNDYRETFVVTRDSRQVSVSLIYRFGKRTLPPSMRHRGGAEDEKGRVSNNTG